MKVAIMQPYFFPYIGYYSLIKHSDKFIIFDPVQFIRHGWIERNRVLKPESGWQYIQVPLVKHRRDTLISDIQIRNTEPWQDKIKAQLLHYKKRSPYYTACMDVVTSCLSIQTDSIVKLNEHILKTTCQYLGINIDFAIFSEMNLEIEPVHSPDEWALHISKAIGAKEYINPPGGQDFFDKKKYSGKEIGLTFLSTNINEYDQKRAEFESGLSIIDLMMFNSSDSIRIMMDDVKQVK